MMAFIVLFLFTALTFSSYLLTPKIKGIIGEKTVSAILRLLHRSKYTVIDNIVLNNEGKTSQIDHLVISDSGLFVIETKNCKGWIFGSEHSEYWTQVLYKRKERFYSPIRQNLGHIKALKNCLHEFPDIKFISIIVFSSSAEIKTNTITEVTNTYGLLKAIKKHSGINLTKNEKEKIFQKLNTSNLSATYDKEQHINSVAQRARQRRNAIHERKCPQCGNELVLRNGIFGSFLGCRSFPGCKFTITAR